MVRSVAQFTCGHTGEVCSEAGCSRNICIIERERARRRRGSGAIVRSVRLRVTEAKLIRMKNDIAWEVIRSEEKRRKKRFRRHHQLARIADLVNRPEIEREAVRRLMEISN